VSFAILSLFSCITQTDPCMQTIVQELCYSGTDWRDNEPTEHAYGKEYKRDGVWECRVDRTIEM
jgi:hypothetical protein